MANFFDRILRKEPPAGATLRPVPPRNTTQLARDIEGLRAPFLTSSLHLRSQGLAALRTYLQGIGGISESGGNGDPATFIMQEVGQSLFYGEQVDLYYALAEEQKIARAWKLTGLSAYWNAFRWKGLMYLEIAKNAFEAALALPNEEQEQTPYRIREWLLKVEFLEAYSRDDDELVGVKNEQLYAEARRFYEPRGVQVKKPSSEERWNQIEDECVNDRGCDYKTGKSIWSAISNQLVNAGLDETITLDSAEFRVWNINRTGPTQGALFFFNSAGSITMLDFFEDPPGSSKYRIAGG